jgi:hypothetical protein
MSEQPHIESGKTAGYRRVPERLMANPKARLRDQFCEVCRFKHLSERTEEAYWGWVRRFLVFHRRPLTPALSPDGAEGVNRWRHPRELGGAEVQAFLTHLATERGVGSSTQNQAL